MTGFVLNLRAEEVFSDPINHCYVAPGVGKATRRQRGPGDVRRNVVVTWWGMGVCEREDTGAAGNGGRAGPAAATQTAHRRAPTRKDRPDMTECTVALRVRATELCSATHGLRHGNGSIEDRMSEGAV